MKQYVVTITYTDDMTSTSKTISFWRKAMSGGEAIASASAIFNSLSNTNEDNGNSTLHIYEVSVSEYVPD